MMRIGVVGSAFAGSLHAESIAATGRAQVCAGVSRSAGGRAAFGDRWSVPTFETVEEMLDSVECDAISLAVPNNLHREMTEAAASRGVSVICEKPLARTWPDAVAMVEACERAGTHLLYAEQLCFAPRYQRVKALLDDGAFGRLFQIQHWERHGGPHAGWFYDPAQSGGGVALDMGCHGIAVARWLMGEVPVVEVSAQMGTYAHPESPLEDHSSITLRFADDTIAVIDSSWAAPGGIDERLELLGTAGQVTADLARGQSLLAYSDTGVGEGAEKATHSRGLLWVPHDEARTWGWYGEFAHFVDVLEGRAPAVLDGSDGLDVLGIVYAAYAAAAERRVVTRPWPVGDHIPAQPWLDR